jgi:hypothetical protein
LKFLKTPLLMKTNKDQRQKYTLIKRYDKVWMQIKAKTKTKSGSRKIIMINSAFVSCSVLTDFYQYLFLPLCRFLCEFFWSWNSCGSCYSSIYFICGIFELKPEAKRGWLYVMPTLMLLIDLCLVLYEGSFQV